MAEKRKITKKVISSVPLEQSEPQAEEQTTQELKRPEKTKTCFFCKGKTMPSYTDIVTLRRYLTDRAKIVPKSKSNLCSKHQRTAARQIKYARHLALLPFTPKV